MHHHQKFYYQCISCEAEYDAVGIIYLCPACKAQNKPNEPPKGLLKVMYDYEGIGQKINDFNQMKQNHFLDLLPIEDLQSLPNLRIGGTPLYEVKHLEKQPLPFSLFLKDDSQNPTFSFKDRASALVSAFAKERGIETLVVASTGNAGSSLAGICAAQKQKAIIMVPESAPIAKLTQIVMYGALLVPVKGTYDEAFDLSVAATQEFGWYNRNTAYNPLTIEGKKTVAFEIFDQLMHSIPDRIFVPVGDGVILSGVYKGFEDLMQLGFLSKMPTVVGVQAAGSDNLARNLHSRSFEIKPSHTVADSISVNIPRNFYMTQQYIQKYNGEIITVTDEEILNAAKMLAKETGIFTEPASAAAFAGLIAFNHQKKLPDNFTNVILLTGSGLKDLKALSGTIKNPPAIDPDIENLKHLIS